MNMASSTQGSPQCAMVSRRSRKCRPAASSSAGRAYSIRASIRVEPAWCTITGMPSSWAFSKTGKAITGSAGDQSWYIGYSLSPVRPRSRTARSSSRTAAFGPRYAGLTDAYPMNVSGRWATMAAM